MVEIVSILGFYNPTISISAVLTSNGNFSAMFFVLFESAKLMHPPRTLNDCKNSVETLVLPPGLMLTPCQNVE